MLSQPLALLLSMTHWSPEPKEHLPHCFPLASSHGGPTMHTHSYRVKVVHRMPCDGHIKWVEGTHTVLPGVSIKGSCWQHCGLAVVSAPFTDRTLTLTSQDAFFFLVIDSHVGGCSVGGSFFSKKDFPTHCRWGPRSCGLVSQWEGIEPGALTSRPLCLKMRS